METPDQLHALVEIRAWRAAGATQPRKVFKLRGRAGSGKTWLLKKVAAECQRPRFLAPTGKAASVMAGNGCVGAQTYHSAAYTCGDPDRSGVVQLENKIAAIMERIALGDPWDYNGDDDYLSGDKAELDARLHVLQRQLPFAERAARQPRYFLNPASTLGEADLIILDEVSMIDERAAMDLLSFNVLVLACGDGGQLPPVQGMGYFMQGAADATLEQIHRQAAGSPILTLAGMARDKKDLPIGVYSADGHEDCEVTTQLEKGEGLKFDQIIVGLNATRVMYNMRMRELLGHRFVLPEKGERLICKQNGRDSGLLNGVQYETLAAAKWHPGRAGVVELALREIGGTHELECLAHSFYFDGKRKREEIPWWQLKDAREFDFGYAITCHSAQGSQWPRVLIMDESHRFRGNRFKWSYTSVTRAQKSIKVLKDE